MTVQKVLLFIRLSLLRRVLIFEIIVISWSFSAIVKIVFNYTSFTFTNCCHISSIWVFIWVATILELALLKATQCVAPLNGNILGWNEIFRVSSLLILVLIIILLLLTNDKVIILLSFGNPFEVLGRIFCTQRNTTSPIKCIIKRITLCKGGTNISWMHRILCEWFLNRADQVVWL